MEKYIGVILPGDPNRGGGPTFDKIVAYHLFLKATGLRETDLLVEFYGSSEPEDPRVEELVGQGYFPIDVGRWKYQNMNLGSAAEVVAQDIKFRHEAHEAIKELSQMTVKNNQTGYLKGFPKSLVWALREAYKVERDPRRVVRKVLDAVEVFFKLYGKSKDDPTWRVRQWKEERQNFRTLEKILPRLSDNFSLFTLPWLVRGMFELGWPMEAVRDTALWWLRVFDAADRAKAATAAKLDQQFREEFEVNRMSGCVIHTDDPMAGRHLIGKEGYALVVIRHSSGNVSILTNKRFPLDIGAAVKALNHEDSKSYDREVWFFDERMQCALNGSLNWAQPATSLAMEEIIKILQANVRQERKRF